MQVVVDAPVAVHQPEELDRARISGVEERGVVAGLDAGAEIVAGRQLASDDDVALRRGEAQASLERARLLEKPHHKYTCTTLRDALARATEPYDTW